MKFGASAKSFLAFLCLFAIMMALTAYSSPAAYIAASTSLSIADRLLNISCMDLAARLLKFPRSTAPSSLRIRWVVTIISAWAYRKVTHSPASI